MTPTPTPTLPFGFLETDEPVAQLLINIFFALVILAVAIVLASLVRRWIVRMAARSNISLNIAHLLGNLAQISIVTLGVIFSLPFFGIEWTALVAVVGAAGLVLGLALQDVLKNIVAGIYLLVEQPFRIGDRITIKEQTGVVQSIELRTTILCTDENLQVVVPNNTVLTEIVTNRSASDLQRQVITVRISNVSLTETSKQISDVLRAFSEVATSPAPVVALEGAYADGAVLRVEFWVPATERIALTPKVVEALRARFPQANVTVV
jgi:small conductance mechanosensitive channel